MAQRLIRRSAASYAEQGARNEGWDGLLTAIHPLLANADVAFCNLESPILDISAPRGDVEGEEYPKFCGPLAMVSAMRDAGMRVVSVANNHAHDMGPKGVEGTEEALRTRAIVAVGFTRDGHPLAVGMRSGRWQLHFIGATLKMNKTMPPGFSDWDVWQLDPHDPSPLLAEIARARATGQECIVSLHWGAEWGTGPDDAQRSFARRLCDAGAVVVLGHHAHVTQPLEVYRSHDGRTCLIAWCLGNLVAFEPHSHQEANLGLLARIVLDGDVQGRLQLQACSWQPTWAMLDGNVVRIVALDADTDLARRARATPDCRRELEAAERRLGPRQIKILRK